MAAFSPRYLPQSSPQTAPAAPSDDFANLSDEELARIAQGGGRAAPAAGLPDDGGGDQAALLAQLLGGDKDESAQADFQNILALLELLQQDNAPDQATPMPARMPPTGSNREDIGASNEIEASTMYTRDTLADLADQAARQRNQASLDRNPVQMMPAPARGPGLSDSLAQATSLYDLIRNRGATAAPGAGGYEPTVSDSVQTSDAQNAALRAKELLQQMLANMSGGGGGVASPGPARTSGNPLYDPIVNLLKGLPGL